MENKLLRLIAVDPVGVEVLKKEISFEDFPNNFANEGHLPLSRWFLEFGDHVYKINSDGTIGYMIK